MIEPAPMPPAASDAEGRRARFEELRERGVLRPAEEEVEKSYQGQRRKVKKKAPPIAPPDCRGLLGAYDRPVHNHPAEQLLELVTLDAFQALVSASGCPAVRDAAAVLLAELRRACDQAPIRGEPPGEQP